MSGLFPSPNQSLLADTPAPAAPSGTPSPQGAAFTPAPIDHDKLSPLARHELKQAVNAGTEAAYAAWMAKHVGAAAPAADAVATGTPADAAPEMSPALADVAAKLEAAGSHIDLIGAMSEPVSQFHDRLAAMSDEEMASTMASSEDRILRQHYRGSEAAYAAGLQEIAQASRAVGIDPGQLYDAGVLSDPSLHLRILGMARVINRGA